MLRHFPLAYTHQRTAFVCGRIDFLANVKVPYLQLLGSQYPNLALSRNIFRETLEWVDVCLGQGP